ncbi:MAG: hypothetical protein U0491_00330 [Candidatus Saccharimonadales bacterium]
MIKRFVYFGIFATFMIAILFTFQIPTNAAISNQAHSPSEETFPNRVYLVTAYSSDVTAPTSTVDIFFKVKPSAAFTIDIANADLCKTNARGYTTDSAVIDAGFSSITSGDKGKTVTTYTATWGTSSKSVGGVVNLSTANPPVPSCTRTISLTAAQAKAIPYDATTNSWKMGLTATGATSKSLGFEYVNAARIIVNDSSALVSYRGYKNDAANWQKYIYAVDAQGRNTAYGNITFPISPDCSVSDGTTVTRAFYISDPDNGNDSIQPDKWYVRLINLSTGKAVAIESSSNGTESGTNFYPSGLSGVNSYVSYKMTGGVNYRWEHIHVYDNNTLKFAMPFDSIGCQYPTATATPKVTALTPTSTGTTPVSFTKKVIISDFQSTPFSLSYKVSRKINNGAYVDISSSTLNNVTANGTYSLANETYNPSVGDTSACFKLTLLNASPTPNFVKLNPPSEDCTNFVAPPTLTLTGATYEKGAGGSVKLRATVQCNSLTGTHTITLSNSSGMPAVGNGSVTCSVNTTQTYDFTEVNSGNVLDGSITGGKHTPLQYLLLHFRR